MWRFKIFTGYNLLVATLGYWIGRLQYALGEREQGLQTLTQAAAYCVSNYTGTYYWAALERFLLRIARKDVPDTGAVPRPGSGKRVLHVITTAYRVGGHTRFLVNWIHADPDRMNAVVFLDQKVPVPEQFLKLQETRPETELVMLDQKQPLLARAGKLRSLAASFDYVVLHVHSQELLPILAFGVPGLPPVAYMNHADHAPWVGWSVTDLLVQYRETFAAYDSERRNIERFTILPIPIARSVVMDPGAARAQLGIAPDRVVLLTISSEYKFKPTRRHHYFESVTQMLDQFPQALLYIIGIKPGSELARRFAHERIRFAGIQEDTTAYEWSCDVYLDSFPFSSPTSAMQVMAKGKPALLMYAPAPANVVFPYLPDLAYPQNKEEWHKRLAQLLHSKEYREKTGQSQLAYIRQAHDIQNGWKERLQALYLELDGIRHEVHVPGRSKKVYAKEDALIYLVTNTNLRLGGIVITGNPVLRFFTKAVSAALVVLRRLIDKIFLDRYVRQQIRVNLDPDHW